ncbi:MAG: HAMP domain-containing sensor histidine kinase [Vicinamibacteraceae bacterium]
MSERSALTARGPGRTDGGGVIWYRSFYWRIAIGFVATVAVVLVLQAALFVWLASTNDAIAMRPGRLAAVAAAELATALEADAQLDVDAWLAREFGRSPHGVFVVRGDRVHRSGPFEVPPFLARMARVRSRVPETFPDSGDQPPPGNRPPRPRRPPFQPVVVGGQTVAVVGVLPAPGGRDPVLAEFGPTLVAAALVLLIAGTTVMAILVFRPVHRRLRGLEQAAAAVGAGETAVRAPETGGDEVASLARRFNRMAADLDARVQELRSADRSRRQLLADVSHELMTPLTAMRGYLETLALPAAVKDEATRARYLGIVTEETLRLEAIIGDLLDLARLEGGGGSFDHERVPVARLFERVYARHQGALEERGVTLDREIAPGADVVVGDERRLEQVLQNLVANAVRHTPRGGRIALRAAPDRADVVLVVEDSGAGIPAEHLPHVFDRFYRVDSARDAQSGGSGLGLSIVRAVIDQHGGRVSATNGTLGGARFELSLPAIGRGAPPAEPLSVFGTRS